jgi:hypothetical protein
VEGQGEQYSYSKISMNFAARLARLDPDQRIRTIVLPVARTDLHRRESIIAMTKQQGEWAFDVLIEIDMKATLKTKLSVDFRTCVRGQTATMRNIHCCT